MERQHVNPEWPSRSHVACWKALQDLFPDDDVQREVRINQPIVVDDRVVRNYFVVDFWLKKRNTIIEFHGGNHYGPFFSCLMTDWGRRKAVETFHDQQIRDDFVRQYCVGNGIKLVEINAGKARGDKLVPRLREAIGIP